MKNGTILINWKLNAFIHYSGHFSVIVETAECELCNRRCHWLSFHTSQCATLPVSACSPLSKNTIMRRATSPRSRIETSTRRCANAYRISLMCVWFGFSCFIDFCRDLIGFFSSFFSFVFLYVVHAIPLDSRVRCQHVCTTPILRFLFFKQINIYENDGDGHRMQCMGARESKVYFQIAKINKIR